MRNPVLDLRLDEVMRPQIALPLQQVLHLYTVGNFLGAWQNPHNHKSIAQIFDSPQQARHAAAVCAAWLGIAAPAVTQPAPPPGWWRSDTAVSAAA